MTMDDVVRCVLEFRRLYLSSDLWPTADLVARTLDPARPHAAAAVIDAALANLRVVSFVDADGVRRLKLPDPGARAVTDGLRLTDVRGLRTAAEPERPWALDG